MIRLNLHEEDSELTLIRHNIMVHCDQILHSLNHRIHIYTVERVGKDNET